MKKYIVQPSRLEGEIAIPPSKSQTLRALLFGAMGNGKSTLHNSLLSPDTEAMIEACRLFGARVDVQPNTIDIYGLDGKIGPTEDVINAGNSGIVLRFCSAIAALSPHSTVITGDHSIRHNRPMKPLLRALSQLGAQTLSTRGDDFAPILVTGPLISGKASLCGQDSQPVSALLIASSFAKGPIDIEVSDPGEKPWVALTLDWFDRLGISYTNTGFTHYHIPGGASYSGFEYRVPGDLSSLAFPMAAALVTDSEITISNVDIKDPQGDKELISIFQNMGAQIKMDSANRSLHVKKSSPLRGIAVDINNCIDAITILAVVGCFADGETVIYNAATARHKECNRIESITTELKKMGADITETNSGLVIRKSKLRGGSSLHSYHDHRMAMSLAVAALGAEKRSEVLSTTCVAKTFPTFLKDFIKLGAKIEERTQ